MTPEGAPGLAPPAGDLCRSESGVCEAYFPRRGLLSSRGHTRRFRRRRFPRYSGRSDSRSLSRQRTVSGTSRLARGQRGEPTLVTVDSKLAVLARLTGGSVETFVAPTNSGSVGSVHADSVPEAGPTAGSRTGLTVLPEEARAAPGNLRTEASAPGLVLGPGCSVTHQVPPEAGGSAAHGQQALLLKQVAQQTLLLPHRRLQEPGRRSG